MAMTEEENKKMLEALKTLALEEKKQRQLFNIKTMQTDGKQKQGEQLQKSINCQTVRHC